MATIGGETSHSYAAWNHFEVDLLGAHQVEQFTFSCLETAAALESKLLDLKDLLNKVAGTTCGNIWWVAHNADGFERLAFYEAHNPTDRVVAGSAAYNVTPYEAGGFFGQIACFCW